MIREPRTRAGMRKLREEFNNSVENLIAIIELEELHEDKADKEIQEIIQEHLKIPTTVFLPVFQGIKEASLFTISSAGKTASLEDPPGCNQALDRPLLAHARLDDVRPETAQSTKPATTHACPPG